VRGSPWASSLLDGVNVAALGLMAAVMWRLATDAMVDVLTAALAAVSAVLLIQWRVNSAWRVLLGGVGNVVYQYLT
jgi:chromate transporter